eukprot:1318661-Rhodomonas_salina.1
MPCTEGWRAHERPDGSDSTDATGECPLHALTVTGAFLSPVAASVHSEGVTEGGTGSGAMLSEVASGCGDIGSGGGGARKESLGSLRRACCAS